MSLHFEIEHDVDEVFELLTDSDFLVDRSLELGELEASCEVEQDGEQTVVSMTRKLERELPSFLAKMFDPVQVMRLTERWTPDGEGGWSGEYVFEIEGQPATISATFELYPTDDGCCYSIEHRAKAKIPLIGGRVEKYIQGQAREGCTDEIDYLVNTLAG